MAVSQRAQIHMEDEWIENPELLDLLEKREESKEGAATFRQLDKDAKGQIRGLNLEGERRIGRFVISCKATKGRSVSFETDGGVRVNIKAASED